MPPYFPSPTTIHLPILMLRCDRGVHSFILKSLTTYQGATQSLKWNIPLPHGALTFSHQPCSSWGPHCAAQPLPAVPHMSSLLTSPHVNPLSPGSPLAHYLPLSQLQYLCVARPSPPHEGPSSSATCFTSSHRPSYPPSSPQPASVHLDPFSFFLMYAPPSTLISAPSQPTCPCYLVPPSLHQGSHHLPSEVNPSSFSCLRNLTPSKSVTFTGLFPC